MLKAKHDQSNQSKEALSESQQVVVEASVALVCWFFWPAQQDALGGLCLSGTGGELQQLCGLSDIKKA